MGVRHAPIPQPLPGRPPSQSPRHLCPFKHRNEEAPGERGLGRGPEAVFSAWKSAQASVWPGGEDGSQPAGRKWGGLPGRRRPPPHGPGGHPLPEGAWALLQGGSHHVFVLFLADGARGVDEPSQGRECERVAQRPLLEGSQRSQALRAGRASLGLLQLSAGHP